MKRRVDEVPFGGPRTGPTTAAHHRILTPQNAPQPPTIQYQLNPGVLKVASATSTNSNNNNNNSSSSSNVSNNTGGNNVNVVNESSSIVVGNQSAVIGSQAPPTVQTTQYTTYQSGMTVTGAGGNVVTRNLALQQPVTVQQAPSGLNVQLPQQISGQVHVVNTSANALNVSNRHKSGGTTTTTVIGSSVGPTSIVTIGQPQQIAQINASPVVLQQQGGPPPTPPSSGQFQRLKVEDALVYLDNVKSKFGDQPQVYNDFLDIMKEFKSQSIDTPGVIERVSTLFKGHPDLIVGFNTFLPPGYKIEIQANDETGYSYQVSVSMPSPSRGSTTTCQQQQQSPSSHKVQILQSTGTMIQTGGPVNLITHSSLTTNIHGNAGLAQPPTTVVNSSTTGVVSSLGALGAASNSNNIGSATTFGGGVTGGAQSTSTYVIRSGSIGGGDKDRNAGGGINSINVGALNNNVNNLSSQTSIRSQMENLNSQGHNLHHISQAHHIVQQQQQQQQQSHQGDALGAGGGNMNIITQATGGGGSGGNQSQPVEFNHAITYVNKIKKRFAQQPEKYKRFLEILHQYQKEQKNVRGDAQGKQLTEQEVYSQVAILFDKNEDLLKEFGQFLPDATSHSSTLYGSGPHKSALIDHNDHKKLGGSSDANLIRGGAAGGGGSGLGTGGMIRSYNNSSNNYSRVDHRSVIGGMGSNMSGNMAGGLLSNEYMHSGLDKDQYHLQGMRDKDRIHVGGGGGPKYGQVKRSPSFGNNMGSGMSRGALIDRNDGPPPAKRHKPICRDVTFAEASKYSTLNDFAFFDKVRKALRSPEVYENFLRCLILFNQEIVSKAELLNLTAPFLSKFPELHRWFQEFLGPAASMHDTSHIPMQTAAPPSSAGQRQDRSQSEHAQEIDLSTCKRLGASYCALPKTSEVKKCSGRTALCREVLNDTWVSFPTWSEDSTFVTSRKTQYEEIIYRCEDERFELDVVIETNSATIRVLEGVQKKMSRMSSEEMSRFRLDDCLGGNSPTIHQRALRRIYGDKAADIIQGLKKNPVVAVPVVLRRLKTKEEEWREAQKGFNKQWREQNEKYYLKSLDHQGINFKQNDIKSLRSKSLFNEIETLYDERHEQNEEIAQELQPVLGPHLVLPFKDKTILEDAANLLIHHVKRQTGIQKQEKTKIKQILRHLVPDLFFSPRQQLSDDEREDDKDMAMDVDPPEGGGGESTSATTLKGRNKSSQNSDEAGKSSEKSAKNDVSSGSDNRTLSISSTSECGATKGPSSTSSSSLAGPEASVSNCKVGSVSSGDSKPGSRRGSGTAAADGDDDIKMMEIKQEDEAGAAHQPHTISNNTEEEAYTLFFANNNWYLFLRLHAILCERLRSMYERAQILAAEEAYHKTSRRESTATALRLKPKSEVQVEDFYSTFLDMLKNVLDGNLDGNNYEDSLREMFGIHAYVAFTLDRVVSNAVRQLQHCVTEKGATECVELFHQEQKKNGAGGFCKTATKRSAAELAYQRRAEQSLQDENCFKIYIYKINCRVTVELLDTESEESEKTVTTTQEWSSYVERYTNPGIATSNLTSVKQALSTTRVVSGNATSSGGSVTITSCAAASTMISSSTNHPSKPDDLSEMGGGVEKVDDETGVSNAAAGFREPRKFLRRNVKLRCPGTKNGKTVVISCDGTQKKKKTEDSDGRILSSSSGEEQCLNRTGAEGKGSAVPLRILTKEKNYFEANDPFLNKRPPERLGESSVNSDYHVVDCTEVKLNISSYKMVMLTNKFVIFYHRYTLRRARQIHEAVTKRMKSKFKKFVDNWLHKNVTEGQKEQCMEWMMGRASDHVANATVKLQENDLKKTPYYLYNRYKVKKMD